MAERLLETLEHLQPRDTEADKIVKEILFNTLDGKDLEELIAKELLFDPVKTRLIIMRRLKRIEKVRPYSDHIRRLKQLLLGGGLAGPATSYSICRGRAS